MSGRRGAFNGERSYDPRSACWTHQAGLCSCPSYNCEAKRIDRRDLATYHPSIGSNLRNQGVSNMGQKMRVSKEDLAKGKVIEPGWYPAECTGYEQKPSKEDKSLNTTFAFKILEGTTDSRQNDLSGVKLYRLFNEKGMGFAASFIATVRNVEAIDPEGTEFDPDEAKGKRMMVYVTNEDYKGRPQNRVEDFRPIG